MTPTPRQPRADPVRRLGLLAASLMAGLGLAGLGHWLWPGLPWALAIPLALAVAWWLVADPTQCQPPKGDR